MRPIVAGLLLWSVVVAAGGAAAAVKEGESLKPRAHGSAEPSRPANIQAAGLPRVGPALDRAENRANQELSVERMQRAIAKYLETRFEGRVSEVTVGLVEPQDPIMLPGGVLEIAVAGSGSEDVVGRRHFRLSVDVDGKDVTPVAVTADVSALADVVAPTRMIKADELIEAGDVTVKRVKVNSLQHPFVSDVNEAVGKSAAKTLPPQMPIRVSALAKPYAVRKGDRVTIEAKRGGLAIQTVGVTKTGAQLGEFVTVTNQDSGKDIRGKVVGPGLVRVEF